MPTLPTATALGYGSCCTDLPSKGGERCGARVLWKLDKNGRAFYRCRGEYDGRACGVQHGPLSAFETEHLLKSFDEAKRDEPREPAKPAGKRSQKAESVGDGDGSGKPESVDDGDGSGDPQIEPEREKSGYIFDQ